MPHRCANYKIPVGKILLGTHFYPCLFIFKYLLFGINVLRINYPSGHSVEVSRTSRPLQEDQSQGVLSSNMAEFHILIPIQVFVSEKT